ncbi:hypothetical protein [Streptococcus orisasini]|uniref:hypothetical protein n=1 Tax=Streptococcus orisasini TaxID=1080071 RepID=UPI000710278B|nr:hypothetical protein [Streptococcus orisasini]
MSKFKVLSRRNLLIYEAEGEVFLKTAHYQLTAPHDKVSINILKKILKATRQVISIDSLCSFLKISEYEILQYIKLLREIGAVFIFQSDVSTLDSSLIDLLCVYGETNLSIDDFIEKVDDICIYIPEQFNKLFNLLTKLKLHCKFAEIKEVQIKMNGKTKKIFLSQNYYKDIFFDVEQIYNHSQFDYNKLNYVQKLMFDHYFSIFIIKQIIGNNLVGAVLNHEGQFEEFRFNQYHFEMLMSDVNIPTNDIADISRRVRLLENVLQNNKFPYSLSKHRNSALATVHQNNKVVFGIHDDLNKREFLFAGTDFLISFLDTFIIALQYSLEKLSGKSWIVCRAEDYYEKKLDKLCQIINVGEQWYVIDEYNLNNRFDIKVIQGEKSGLYNFIIRNLETKKIFKFSTPFSNVENSKKILADNISLLENQEQLVYDSIFENQSKEKFISSDELIFDVETKIEKLQTAFEEKNINYTEKKWIYEQLLDNVGIVVRQIEVDNYGKSS